jgi:hypothetical protein
MVESLYWLIISLKNLILLVFGIELYFVSPPGWTVTKKLFLCFAFSVQNLHSRAFS